jgi:hypothetical protein
MLNIEQQILIIKYAKVNNATVKNESQGAATDDIVKKNLFIQALLFLILNIDYRLNSI